MIVGSGGRTSRWRQLRAELSTIWPEERRAEAPAAVGRLLDSGAEQPPTWEAVLEAELNLVQSIGLPALRLKHGSLIDEFTALAECSEYVSNYLGRLAPADSSEEETLRAQALELTVQKHRLLKIRHGFNVIRSTVGLIATLLVLLFCGLIVGYFASETRTAQEQSTFATSMLVLAGMLGGCVSALSRLYSVAWSANLATGAENLGHLFWSLVINFLLAVIEGGIFAVLLYLAFMGNLVSGTLFPTFRNPVPTDMNLFHIFLERGLNSHGDFAKALVWGFLAGFSERLVPDFLNTLGGKLGQTGKS
jgi:hypothetical protein